MLQIVPPEDYTEGVTGLVRLVDESLSMQQKRASERVKATHDLVYLLGSKASKHAHIETGSQKVDKLKGEIVEADGQSVFKSTDTALWRAVFPSGLPNGITTKCFDNPS